jgi:hypothetical protein
MKAGMRRLWLALLPLLAVGAACSHQVATEKLENGSYRLKCAGPLDHCLREGATNACDGHAYFVVRAIEETNFEGRQDIPLATRTSEAVIQCDPDRGWGNIKAKELMSGGADAGAPPAAPAKPTTTCTPGATQTCVGPGACQGGQACKGDGSGYGPCDCGAPAAAPPPAS